MNVRIKKTGAIVATAIALVSASGVAITSAQTNPPATPPATQTAPQSNPNQQGNRPARPNLAAVTACSVTNYDDVAAQALGIQSSALRQALVGGQTLAQIATSKNVSIDIVNTALKTAYEADLIQAVTDGLITQQVADQIKTALDNAPAAPAAAPNATQPATPSAAAPNATQSAAPNGQNPPAAPNGQVNPPTGAGPRNPGFGGNGAPFGGASMIDRLIRVPRTNTISPYQVASKAIGVSCVDLVKAVEGGQSIAQVATSKNVTAQTVIDALVTAQKAAIAQDVAEGLIGQAQATAQTANVTARFTALVNNVGGQRGPGGFGFGGFGPGPGGFGQGFGQGNVPPQQGGQGSNSNGAQPGSNPNGQPAAQPTAPAVNQ